MKNYTHQKKQALREKIIALQETSGLSGNKFAVERLGFSNGSKFSHVRNNWDKNGMVGNDTWEAIEKYIAANNGYKAVKTENLKKVWNSCERAYLLKKPMVVIGEGGTGKTFAIEKYKQHIDAQQRFQVIIFDASETKATKQFIVGLLEALGIYKPGTIAAQLRILRDYSFKKNLLVIIDEVSSLKDHHIVIIKDVMTALKDKVGILFTGTPYFMNNLNKGAIKDRHLFSETRDRLFMLPELLEKPTEAEALEIFKANGVTNQEDLDVVMGYEPQFVSRSWLAKKSFRGIKDAIDMLEMIDIEIDFDNIQL